MTTSRKKPAAPKPAGITLGPETAAKVAEFHAKQKAHAEAEQAFKLANDASSRAGSVRKAAAEDLAKAKAAMQAAFLQEVDPMPMVPAPREEKMTINLDFMGFPSIFPRLKP